MVQFIVAFSHYYSVRLNKINSAREPCLLGSGTEVIGYGQLFFSKQFLGL